MSDQPSFPDQSTTDALSALSALASQASLHPAYEFAPNEDGGNQNLQLHEGEGHPPPPSSTTNLPHLNHNNDVVEGQWDAAQDQTFAEMVAENEAHQAIEAAARGGESLLLGAAGHPSDLDEGGEGSRAHEQVVQAIHAASQAQAQAQAAGNASAGGAGSAMDSNEPRSGGSQTGEKKPKKIRAPGTTVTNPFAHQWLLENYVPSPQTTIQRTSMYASYVSVCEASEVKPVNAATFGKSIRSTFENVRTRRLGNRGNSRYNYCGIKAFTQAELDRLVQFGNVTTENGAICPTKVKRKKTNPSDPADVSMEDAADGDDDENDEDGFDEDEEDEFDDDEDDLLPAHNRSAPSNPGSKASSSKRTPGKTTKPGTVHIVEIEINGQWVPHIPDGNDGYVPSDSKGNPLVPLPPPLGSDIASTSASVPASADGAVQEPTSTSNGPARPKRNRNSLAPEIVASMLDDSDTPSTTPKGKKRGPPKEGDGEWAGAAKVAKKPKVGGGASAKSTPKGKGKAVGKTTEPKVVKKDALTEGFDQLRDVVPALRAVFRTTTPLTQALDTPDPATGLIDGILPVSTLKESKVTILVTAKKYIDHLDKERQKTERARKGLEEFIKKVEGGVEALRGWREYFEISEKALVGEEQAARAIAAAAAVPSLPSHPDLRDHNAAAGPSCLSGYDPNLEPSLLHPDLQPEGSSSSNHFSDPSNPYDNLLLHGSNDHFEDQQHYEQAPGPAPFDTSSFALAALAPALIPALATVAAEHDQQGEDAPESEEARKVAETRLKNRRKQQQYREKQKSKMLDLEEQIRQMAQNQPSASSSSSSQQHTYPDQQHDATQHQLQEDQNQALLHLGQQFKQEAFEEQNDRGLTLRDLLHQQEELQQQLGNQDEDQFYDQLDEEQELDQLSEEQE